MPDESDKIKQQSDLQFESRVISAADAQDARNASPEDIRRVQDLNIDRSNGSFQFDPTKASVEIVAHGVSAGRLTGLTEKDLEQAPALSKPQYDVREVFLTAELQNEFGSKKLAKKVDISQSGIHLAIEAKSNPALEPVALLRAHADSMEDGIEKEKLVALARLQAKEITNPEEPLLSHETVHEKNIAEIPDSEPGPVRSIEAGNSYTPETVVPEEFSIVMGQLSVPLAEVEPLELKVEEQKTNFDVGKYLEGEVRKQVFDLALIEVGVSHGTVNFVTNTLAGTGNGIRMALAAERRIDPLWKDRKDIDPDATRMLDEGWKQFSTHGPVAARILLQYATTFNPGSPLFLNNYDPEGAEMAMKFAMALPPAIVQELEKFTHADKEHQAAVATESVLSVLALVAAPETLLGKTAEFGSLSKVFAGSKLFAEISSLGKVGKGTSLELGLVSYLGAQFEKGSQLYNAAARIEEKFAPVAKELEKMSSDFKRTFKNDLSLEPQLVDGKVPLERQTHKSLTEKVFEELSLSRKKFRKDGKDYSRKKAAQESGLDNNHQYVEGNDSIKEEMLEKLGYKLRYENKYHLEVNGKDRVISEAQLKKTKGITYDDIVDADKQELFEKYGLTEIEPINGRFPINCKYAGQFVEMPLELRKQMEARFSCPLEIFPEGVRYTKEGYPDFSQFEVEHWKFDKFGSYNKDFEIADKQFNLNNKKRQMLGLTWHHHEDGHRLMLIPTKIHDYYKHTGGQAKKKLN